jgi:4-oxalocrotonate tautomerase
MPLVEVSLIEGRTPEQLRALIAAVTSAVEESLSVARVNVRVILREVPPTHWSVGDKTVAEERETSTR